MTVSAMPRILDPLLTLSEILDISVSCCISRVHQARVLLRAILVGYRAALAD